MLEVMLNAGQAVVSRQEIMDTVWRNQEVTDDALTNCISTLRRKLGDDRRENQYIETIPKRGYRLLATVIAIDEPDDTSAGQDHNFTRADSFTWKPWLAGLLALTLVITILKSQTHETLPEILPDDRTLAVLPFDVYSDLSDIKHFASGLEEELIHQLAENPGMRVIARTSSSTFRDSTLSIHEISEILNVRHIIEGSVREGPSGIRVTIQLIDARTDFHLWSKVFDVGQDHFVHVQEQIGSAVNQLLLAGGGASELDQKPRHPVPDSAYRLFLLGESHMQVGTAQAYVKAVNYFSDATRIAPNYALAYTRMAAAYLLVYQYGHEQWDESAEKALSALNRAFELDPKQAEALAVLGLLRTYEKDFDAAEKLYLRALELQPNLRFALHNYGFMLWSESRYDDALHYLRPALGIDPLSGVTNFLIGDSLVGSGAFEEARSHYQKCQSVMPDYYSCHAGLATLERLKGEYEAASKTLALAGTLVDEGYLWQDLGTAMLAIHRGEYETAERLLANASEKSPLNYSVLKSRLLLSLQKGTLATFINELRLLAQQNPGDRDLNLITALAHYFSSDCESALQIYDKELLSSETFLFDLWDLESGFSHASSLAYCYGKVGQVENQAWVMGLIQEHLTDVSQTEFLGDIYLKSNYSSLAGNVDLARSFQQQLRENNWPLIWLAALEPIQMETH